MRMNRRKAANSMRWLKGMNITLGLAAAIAVTAPTTAQATDTSISSYDQCPEYYFCIWEYGNANRGAVGGHWARFYYGSENLANPVDGFVFNDKVRSVWNRTGDRWCLYVDKEWGGPNWPVGNWKGNSSQYGHANDISSLKRC